MRNENTRRKIKSAIKSADAEALRSVVVCVLDLVAHKRLASRAANRPDSEHMWTYELEWEIARRLDIDGRPRTPRELREGA